MRLLIQSDLHHDIWNRPRWVSIGKSGLAVAPMPENYPPADVVILAGDIDQGVNGVPWAAETFSGTPVLYVSGNHEAYGQDLSLLPDRLRRACRATANVRYLQCSQAIIQGVRFLGTTLWTDYELHGASQSEAGQREAAEQLNDYRYTWVGSPGERLTPEDTVFHHRRERRWLQARLAKPFAGPTVVITHMAPSRRSIPERYRDDLLSAAFASDLEFLMPQVDLWIHGHTHHSVDYRVGRCRVVSNPQGYPDQRNEPENPLFDRHLTIEL